MYLCCWKFIIIASEKNENSTYDDILEFGQIDWEQTWLKPRIESNATLYQVPIAKPY